MRSGDIVRSKSITAVFTDDKVKGSSTWKAGEGRRFVWMLIGTESDAEPLDSERAQQVLRAMGWVPAGEATK